MIRTSLILLLALGACAEMARDASPSRQEEARPTEAEAGAYGGGGELGWAGDEPALAKSAPAPMAPPPPVDGLLDGRMKGESDKAEKKTEGPGGDAEAPTTRSWFPESFLWMPLVQTDASGQAQVEVQVPDSLTTWRVLGLAWSPGGAQAGDVMTVLATKDAYVDLAVPASLYTGDELELPVQVVNTTGEPLSAGLSVEVQGGVGGAAGPLAVGAGGSSTRTVTVSAPRAGTLQLRAAFGAVDAVERAVPVRPAGRPIDTRGSGAVGGAAVAVPAGATGPDGRLQLQVWSGAEAVMAAEVRGGEVMPLDARIVPPGWALADHAYTFALAQAAAALPADVVDPDTLRTRRIRAWQPLVRAGRAPDIVTACLLADALHGAPVDSPEGLLHERMVDTVRSAQGPDGSWATGAATIDGELAQASTCARAVGDDEAVRLRTEGFFTRNRPRLDDPFLAAQALASGAVTDPSLADALRATLHGALVRDADGAWLDGGGNLHADGTRVTREEATAAAALALADDAERGPALATALLAARRPWGGWGDGRTNLLVLRALAAVFDPQTGAAELSVVLDGAVVASGTLVAGAGRSLQLDLPWSGAAGALELRSPAAAPGLVYTWRARSYGAWAPEPVAGTELVLRPPDGARVGQVAPLGVQIATPDGARARAVIGLPAGVHADAAGMEALVAAGAFASWQAAEGSVTLVDVAAGGWEGTLPVVPALAGRLQSGPSKLAVGGEAGAGTAPARWTIGG